MQALTNNQNQTTTIGKLFERIITHCGSDMQEEQQCDARNETTNPAACTRFVQATDDCYEKVICPTEWKIKSECMKKNPNNPEVSQIYFLKIIALFQLIYFN